MGTRADFYIGRGESAEWLGSIALDGYPSGIPGDILAAVSERDYRRAVATLLRTNDYATTPDQGWPWPWTDSYLTDYSYAFEDSMVWVSHFGRIWFSAQGPEPEDEDESKACTFPDMAARRNVTLGKRSGLIVV